MEGSFWQKNLSWEIKNGELVITGDWNETFIIDLEAGEAISKTDEAVYKIVKEQN
jgi:predicted RecA/RadA family phage recombinase